MICYIPGKARFNHGSKMVFKIWIHVNPLQPIDIHCMCWRSSSRKTAWRHQFGWILDECWKLPFFTQCRRFFWHILQSCKINSKLAKVAENKRPLRRYRYAEFICYNADIAAMYHRCWVVSLLLLLLLFICGALIFFWSLGCIDQQVPQGGHIKVPIRISPTSRSCFMHGKLLSFSALGGKIAATFSVGEPIYWKRNLFLVGKLW